MNPELFQQVERLFHEYSGLATAERSQRLVELQARSPEVAQRLTRMLAVSDSRAPTSTGALRLDSGDERPVDIPPYRLDRLLGVGGMGEVWLAEQTEPIRRSVAIKLVRHDLDRRAVLERFRSERQALALMDHPAIAKVLEAGADPRGRPYFVMELVDGQPIHQHCDEHRLSVHERIRLLCRVCDAVQHAHRRGVIHRDLKPSNILVRTHESEHLPTVIDFGIAKAVDPTNPFVASSSGLTEFGQPVGTLDYMSPEQAAGTGVDTRTDVYALGVVLYELLVGRTPFRARGEVVSLADMQQRIANEDPTRLCTAFAKQDDEQEELARSRRSSSPRLLETLRGDLEWIVTRSLEKDPERRYESPAALAEDLQRYLEHRPVEAGPAALSYRIAKFTRRHRGAVASAAAIAAVSILAIAAIILGWTRSEQARRVAASEAAESDATRDFLLSLFEVTDPEGDNPRNLTAPDLLARGAERLRNELTGQPDLEAALSQTIGRLYVKLGLFDEATEHLERAVQLRQAAGEPSELGSAELELARHRLDTGDYVAAATLFEQSAGNFARSKDPEARIDLVRALTELASSHRMLNATDLGLARSQEAIDLAAAALPSDSIVHVPVFGNHAALLFARDDLEGAGEYWQRAIDHVREHLGPDHYYLGSLQQNLGTLRRSQGRWEESVRLLREAERLDAERYGPRHAWVGSLRATLAESLIGVGELDQAELQLASAVSILEESGGGGLEYALLQLGRLRLAQDRAVEALPILHRALAKARLVFGEEHQDTAIAWVSVATTLRQLGDLEEATRYADQALEILYRLYPEPRPLHVSYRLERSEIDVARGDLAAAEERTQADLVVLHRHGRGNDGQAWMARELLQRVFERQGRTAEASVLATSLAEGVGEFGPRHPVRRHLESSLSRPAVR